MHMDSQTAAEASRGAPAVRRRHSRRTLAALAGLAVSAGLLAAAPPLLARPAAARPLAASHGAWLATAAIAARIEPAVVDINVILASGDGEAEGTGMVLTSSGLVLTNNHVVEDAAAITVAVPHRGTYRARVVGVDPAGDVAVIQVVDAPALRAMPFGNPSGAALGTAVVAIGNALGLGGPPSLTTGAITAEGRSVTASNDVGGVEHLSAMLQTSAVLQPGDSGGPLVTRWGAVVGMDTAAQTGASQLVPAHVGFAIPIGRALAIARAIVQGRASATIVMARHGFLGVEVANPQALPSRQQHHLGTEVGAAVLAVVPHTPAALVPLRVYDVLVAVDGHSVANIRQLGAAIAAHPPGSALTVTWVTPAGQRESATVHLTSSPMA